MKNNSSPLPKWLACLLFLLLIPACSLLPSAVQTVQETQTTTPMVTATPSPTVTRTPRPTIYVVPTPTFTEFTLMADETITSIDGSYSLIIPSSFEVMEAESFISFHDTSMYVGASIFANPETIETLYLSSDNEIGLIALSSLGSDGGGGLSLGDSYPIIIDGVEGVAFDFYGTRYGTPMEGEVVIVRRNHIEVLIITGLSLLDEDDQRWSEYDQPLFGEILESFHFNRETPCFVATNLDYGYTESLSIGLGGGEFAGEALVEVYLSSLEGPDGQALTFEKIGSIPYDNTTLLRYRVSYNGLSTPVELFFDINNFTNPMAPAGFSCSSDFEFGLP